MLRTTRCIKLTTFFALAVLLAAPLYAAPATDGVADVVLGTTQVDWVPNSPMVSYSLVVSGPDGVLERSFEAGETPTFNLAALTGDIDGSYSWQLTATPELSGKSRRLMAEARTQGTTFTPKDLPARDELIQSGHFRVMDGAIVQPSANPEPELGIATGGKARNAVSDGIQFVAAADQVIADDLIVTGSLCVGFDCVNGESFGFDTIRLKENNLRIKFDDTSTSGSFPSTDWQITINDSANGGASYYRIEDITNSKVPFTIEANTPNNTLYVDSTGRIGIGTSLPVVEAHIADGDTPTLRLEQNTSSGFGAQTWDVAGNEANFFVRDVTNGSLLPFRIKPGAPSSSLFIAADGDVGLGTESPQQRMHVTGGDARIDHSSSNTVRIELRNSGSSDGDHWEYNAVEATTDHFLINKVGSGDQEFRLNAGGDLIIAGDLTASGTNYPSSRTLKEGFSAVDNREVLQRLAQVPVSVWTYKSDAEQRPHIGPVTEDFSAAFDFLQVDGKLNTIDLHGVAMAAIQGLNELVAEKDAKIGEVQAKNAELEKRLNDLERRIESQ